jgi:hypothetical protein
MGSWTLEDGTDIFSRNVGNYLPIYAATTPVRVKIFMKQLQDGVMNLQKGQPMTQSGLEPDTRHNKAKKSRTCWIRHSWWNFVTTVSK